MMVDSSDPSDEQAAGRFYETLNSTLTGMNFDDDVVILDCNISEDEKKGYLYNPTFMQ